MEKDRSPRPGADLIITGATEVLTGVPAPDDLIGRRAGISVAVAGEHILALCPPGDVARQADLTTARVIDATGKIVAPGFIDCHTHLVFGGSRSQEYAARMTLDPAQIKVLGVPVGIQATVEMTRAANPETLAASAAERLRRMFRHGTTTVESKSGYGLSLHKEIEMLRVNQQLRATQPVDVVSTFLGAHDFPRGMPREAYLDILIHEMTPRVAE